MAANNAEKSIDVLVKVSKNGPYVVAGGIPLSSQIIATNANGESSEWRIEKQYPLTKGCTLCRCGQSKGKPFCDGTHTKISFDGTETAIDKPHTEQAVEYDGPALKLIDAEVFCASARFCHRAGGIWELLKRSDDPEVRKTVIEEGSDCPSGTLVIFDKREGKIKEPELSPSIVLVEDPQKGVSGPIWLRGSIRFESASGRRYETRNRVTLCRCGKSTNKPFCDSSHYPE